MEAEAEQLPEEPHRWSSWKPGIVTSSLPGISAPRVERERRSLDAAGPDRELPRARHADAVTYRLRAALADFGRDEVQRPELVVVAPPSPVRERLVVAEHLVLGRRVVPGRHDAGTANGSWSRGRGRRRGNTPLAAAASASGLPTRSGDDGLAVLGIQHVLAVLELHGIAARLLRRLAAAGNADIDRLAAAGRPRRTLPSACVPSTSPCVSAASRRSSAPRW